MAGRRSTGGRERGYVRTRGNSHQVLVYGGVDPVTGKDSYLSESTRDEKKIPQIRSRLLAKVDRQRKCVSLTRVIIGPLRRVCLEGCWGRVARIRC